MRDCRAALLAFVEQKVACLGIVMPWSSGKAGRTQPRSFILAACVLWMLSISQGGMLLSAFPLTAGGEELKGTSTAC